MGVRGLTYFIDSPEGCHLLKKHKLHNCMVIIDGNSLMHYIYFNGNVSCQFGGDYDVFEREICRVFSIFQACSIEPCVVFDGAYTVDGKKSETTIGRAKDRISVAASIVDGEEKTLIPCLALLTFRQTLDKLGVPHVTCDFEADGQLVVLANLWGCPVISDDSDFYIFELTGGFIPLKHVNFNCHHGSAPFLQVKLYRVENLVRSFAGMNRTVLPVLASVLGNDYVDPSVLGPFHTAVIDKYGKRHERQKILAILRWLAQKQNIERLVSEVVSHISRRKQQRVRQKLTDSITRYKGLGLFESFNLAQVLEGDRDAASVETAAVKKANGNTLPPWFVTACRLAEVPAASLLNVALTQSVVLPVQVEGAAPQAASTTSLPVRQVAYGLLFGNTADLGRQRHSEVTVTEYTKGGTELTTKKVSSRSSLPSYGSLPALTHIPSLSAERRRAILLETLGVSEAGFLDRLDEEIQLYMACLVYWVKHAKPPVGPQHVKAVVLCTVLLRVFQEAERRRDGQAGAAVAACLSRRRSSVGSHGELSIGRTCRSADDALLSSVKQSARQYYENPLRINRWTNTPDQAAFGLNAQFQSCLLDAVNLNCLLQCPVPTPQPATFFNGSLVYSIVQQLQLSRNPESFLHNMLVEGSALATLFHTLCSVVWAASGR